MFTSVQTKPVRAREREREYQGIRETYITPSTHETSIGESSRVVEAARHSYELWSRRDLSEQHWIRAQGHGGYRTSDGLESQLARLGAKLLSVGVGDAELSERVAAEQIHGAVVRQDRRVRAATRSC